MVIFLDRVERGVRATVVIGGAAPIRAGLGNPLLRRGRLSSRGAKSFSGNRKENFHAKRRIF
jgi:hypothetical protein